jgi:hypothetical protein
MAVLVYWVLGVSFARGGGAHWSDFSLISCILIFPFRQTKLIGYPVLPVVKQLVALVNSVESRLGEWSHWGATTQVSTTVCFSMERNGK